MKSSKYYVIKDLFRNWYLTRVDNENVKAYTLQPHIEDYIFFSRNISKFKTREDAEMALFEADSLPSGVAFQIVEVYGFI